MYFYYISGETLLRATLTRISDTPTDQDDESEDTE